MAQYGEEAVQAFIELWGEDELENFEASYEGAADSPEEFAKRIAEETGDMLYSPDKPSWPFYCIDWQRAARELLLDYEQENGHYFRNW